MRGMPAVDFFCGAAGAGGSRTTYPASGAAGASGASGAAGAEGGGGLLGHGILLSLVLRFGFIPLLL
jgi:hypothetical protein